jgi:hypothetical protein
MYLEPNDVRALVERCAARFPGSQLVFDGVPRWLVERGRRGGLESPTGYAPPPWSWWLDRDEERRLGALPHVERLRRLHLPRGRGLAYGLVLPVASRTPVARRLLPSVLAAHLA